MPPKLKDHQPITLHLPSSHVVELKRRALEAPRSRYQAATTHADLIREAVARYLAADSEQKQQAALDVRRAVEAQIDDDELPFATPPLVHFNRGDRKSLCGLVGVDGDQLRRVDADITCPKCKAIVADNGRTLARPTPPATARPSSRRRSKAATKKPAAKASGKGARR